jgi:hypothetical protein
MSIRSRRGRVIDEVWYLLWASNNWNASRRYSLPNTPQRKMCMSWCQLDGVWLCVRGVNRLSTDAFESMQCLVMNVRIFIRRCLSYVQWYQAIVWWCLTHLQSARPKCFSCINVSMTETKSEDGLPTTWLWKYNMWGFTTKASDRLQSSRLHNRHPVQFRKRSEGASVSTTQRQRISSKCITTASLKSDMRSAQSHASPAGFRRLTK